MGNKYILITIIAVLIIGFSSYLVLNSQSHGTPSNSPSPSISSSSTSEQILNLQKEVEELKKSQSSGTPVSAPVSDYKPTQKPVQIPSASKNLSTQEIIAKVKPAVVFIQTNLASGSGMIATQDGFILTNYHVVSGANAITVKLSDGRAFSGTVFGKDTNADLALIKISSNNLPTVEFGNSNSVNSGDEAYTFGYPFGLSLGSDVDFKDGTISRKLTYTDNKTYLEFSAEIYPGNSGGPLVNSLGQVVGINTMSVGQGLGNISLGESIKLAIPINVAIADIPQISGGYTEDSTGVAYQANQKYFYGGQYQISPGVFVKVITPYSFIDKFGHIPQSSLNPASSQYIETFVHIESSNSQINLSRFSIADQDQYSIKAVDPNGNTYDRTIGWSYTQPMFLSGNTKNVYEGYVVFFVPNGFSANQYTIRYTPNIFVGGQQLSIDFACTVGSVSKCL